MKSYMTDGVRMVKSPARWQGRQWLTLGAVATAGVLVYTQDEQVMDFARSHQSAATDRLVKYGLEPWGSGYYSAPLLGGMYLIGRVSGNDRASATALTAGKAAILASASAHLVKQLAHRHRPGQDDPADPGNWDGPTGNIHYTSFPSAHSALAFSVATVLASEYSETVWVPVLSYTLAAGTAVSRIYNDRHWASDVLIGSAAGIAIGRFIWKKNRYLKISPFLDSGATGCIVRIPL